MEILRDWYSRKKKNGKLPTRSGAAAVRTCTRIEHMSFLDGTSGSRRGMSSIAHDEEEDDPLSLDDEELANPDRENANATVPSSSRKSNSPRKSTFKSPEKKKKPTPSGNNYSASKHDCLVNVRNSYETSLHTLPHTRLQMSLTPSRQWQCGLLQHRLLILLRQQNFRRVYIHPGERLTPALNLHSDPSPRLAVDDVSLTPAITGHALSTAKALHVGTVAERLARSPPTKSNRAQSPAGSPDFRKLESCRAMPLFGGFSRGSPVSSALHSGASPYSLQSPSSAPKTSLSKCRPNLFTLSPHVWDRVEFAWRNGWETTKLERARAHSLPEQGGCAVSAGVAVSWRLHQPASLFLQYTPCKNTLFLYIFSCDLVQIVHAIKDEGLIHYPQTIFGSRKCDVTLTPSFGHVDAHAERPNVDTTLLPPAEQELCFRPKRNAGACLFARNGSKTEEAALTRETTPYPPYDRARRRGMRRLSGLKGCWYGPEGEPSYGLWARAAVDCAVPRAPSRVGLQSFPALVTSATLAEASRLRDVVLESTPVCLQQFLC
ncbi:hypothetical protein PR048_031724 [Dryococelus australis]|uniref:Uncharacterized protein n=1 Tax=Dryococelus australis TaxID=614101 RepID=A0ABQ9G635_9NEOP|nr:hypothetical protein PR048_031724 [Dryococelus australis]